MTDIAFDRTSLHAAYAAGLSPVSVAEEALKRIETVGDPGIFISVEARAAVIAAAKALGPFDPVSTPLYGLPFAVKDNIDCAGLPTTAGCPDFAYQPQVDATAVARLRAAGAVLIGKTNLDQFATGLVGVRTPHPVPKNAIDPALVPGGSSSGSAVAVASGIVTFALGTDTAGSGRVPAALNDIVGLKPSVGAVSTAGVVPACRTLDCVSVFAGTVDDSYAAFAAMAAFDPADPYSRRVPVHPPVAPPRLTMGVPTPESLRFFGDALSEAAFAESIADLERLGHKLVPIDLQPFYDIAAMLYDGAWVAERHAAVGAFMRDNPGKTDPVVTGIILGAERLSATAAFQGFYRLGALKRVVEPVLAGIDALIVPTIPRPVTLDEIAAEPIAANGRLGTYTNFVNLLDLAALAVPGRMRPDGRAGGVTLIGPSGSDGMLAGIGRDLHVAARGEATAKPVDIDAVIPDGMIAVAVVGAHLSGMPLNGELVRNGAIFIKATKTAPDYRFFALAGGPPKRPGLVRVAAGEGGAIDLEVWALPADGFGRFVAGIPAPLGIGTVRLADGSTVKGFICETVDTAGAEEVTALGGWRAFMAR